VSGLVQQRLHCADDLGLGGMVGAEAGEDVTGRRPCCLADAATVSTSTQERRDATPEDPELRDKSPITQVNGTNELMTQIHDG